MAVFLKDSVLILSLRLQSIFQTLIEMSRITVLNMSLFENNINTSNYTTAC
jgi:hypothetical protein